MDESSLFDAVQLGIYLTMQLAISADDQHTDLVGQLHSADDSAVTCLKDVKALTK